MRTTEEEFIHEERGGGMNIQVGSKVKTIYKTKLVKKGECGTVKEIYDVANIPATVLVDFRHSAVCYFVRDLEVVE